MKSIRTFRVVPNLPEPIAFLLELANNLWWTWSPEARNLFREVDIETWEAADHNPVRMLGILPQERLDELATDDGFLSYLRDVRDQFEDYMGQPGPILGSDDLQVVDPALAEAARQAPQQWQTTWFKRAQGNGRRTDLLVGYFSAEYGLDYSLPIYSGGLGVLAGDHLKAASDLGLPLVAVGLCYSEGYFRQYLNDDGWQQERYPPNEFDTLPMSLVDARDGSGPLKIAIRVGDRDVAMQVWRVNVGRVPLFLLDTNIGENHPDDRTITARLYGGNMENRLKQEIVLGIGGIRMLQAMDLEPSVLHLNEGHAVFASLERCRQLSESHGLQFAEAHEVVSATTVFTTHTPVPAGNQIYGMDLMGRYFHHYWPQLKLGEQAFFSLGRQDPMDMSEAFGMTVCALRMGRFRNGVSKLHGEVSRGMWSRVWPQVPADEVPIQHVTNGVHVPTWASSEITALFNRYIGTRWQTDPDNTELWQRANKMPAAELWRAHERRREALVGYARQRLRKSRIRRGAPAADIERADDVLDPGALTIAFARRFATYKRGTLILRDFERLVKLLTDRDRPVQILMAGKAHPHDEPGKTFIQEIAQQSQHPEIWRHIVFLEDYEMQLASYLVQGADVWLNTPRRPLEASGTSGMKAALNGVLNCSILDGWWDEAFNGDNGWAIGNGEEYSKEEAEYQNEVESRALYQLLEQEIVPLFYDRGADGIPREWVARMKNSIATVTPFFNSYRQVMDYTEMFYVPACQRHATFSVDNYRPACDLGDHLERLRHAWHALAVRDIHMDPDGRDLALGSKLAVSATVHLGALRPEDVRVELCRVTVAGVDDIASVDQAEEMTVVDDIGNSDFRFSGSLTCTAAGRMGTAIRVLPRHKHLYRLERIPGLIRWA